eukprot:m.71009 g.71009  ORF g.71009 m.71009 type:complete len:165 (-) comp8678_c0_seq1:109-603(-)
MSITIECPECRVEITLEADDEFCTECGHELTAAERAAAVAGDSKYAGYVVGVITKVEQLKEKRYKAVVVDIGADEPISVVTTAKHTDEGDRVVVATVGAVVPAGADADEGTTVTKASVGGRASLGMLCDAPMLGWKGGAAGVAVKLPADIAVGSTPPDTKPASK